MTGRGRELAAKELTVHEAGAYRRAGIAFFDTAMELLETCGVRFVSLPRGGGMARLANLLAWEAGEAREYIEGEEAHADQIVHFALHQFMERQVGGRRAGDVLMAECFASAMDLYLMGKLSAAGEETDFLCETLEDFGESYRNHARKKGDFKRLVQAMVRKPLATALDLTDYLHRFCLPWLHLHSPEIIFRTATFGDHLFYPLIHHFNVSNWILTIRARFGHGPEPSATLDSIRDLVPVGEADFLIFFEQWLQKQRP